MAYNSYTVRLLRTAEEDLSDLLNFALAESGAKAKALLAAVAEELAALAERPKLASSPEEAGLAQAGFRYLVVDDYVIFYTIEEDNVFIHRMIPGASDYKGLFGRAMLG